MKRKIQKACMLFVTFSIVLYANVALASPWISTQSFLSDGDDLAVLGGGAPSSSNVVIELIDMASGEVVGQTTVFTSASGDFSAEFANISSDVEVRMTINGTAYSSQALISSD